MPRKCASYNSSIRLDFPYVVGLKPKVITLYIGRGLTRLSMIEIPVLSPASGRPVNISPEFKARVQRYSPLIGMIPHAPGARDHSKMIQNSPDVQVVGNTFTSLFVQGTVQPCDGSVRLPYVLVCR